MKLLKEYILKILSLIKKEEVKILPGHLAFFLIISIIPAITIIGGICSLFSISINDISNIFAEIIPKGVFEILDPFIKSSSAGIILTYFIIGFLLASNGAYAIIITCDSLYEIKNASYLEGRIKALFLTIILMFLFIFILVVLAFGNIIISFILKLKIFSQISNIIYHLFAYLKWPIAFFIIFILLKLIYTIAPDKKIKSKYVTRGSLFTTICWLFVTAIYSYYANNIARYDMFYGNLSNIIILMMWIYLIAYIFVVGIAINVNEYNLEENTLVNK
jgi:membrane protein